MAAEEQAAEATAKGLSQGAKDLKGVMPKLLKTVAEHPGKSALVLGGLTAVAAMLWPKKEQEITNEQGEVETRRKSSGFRTAAVTLGAAATIGALVMGKGGFAAKILESRALKAAGQAAGHAVG